MKPSQVPNRLLHSLHRIKLPLKSPEMFHKGSPGPPQQPPGSLPLSGIVPSSPANNSPAKMPLSTSMSSKVFQSTYPCSRNDNPGTYHSQHIMEPAHQCSPSSSIRSDQLAEHKVTLPSTGREYGITQKQDSSKVPASYVGSSKDSAQSQRCSVAPSFTPRTGQEGGPRSPRNSHWQPWCSASSPVSQSPDRNHGSRLPAMRSPVAACQDHAFQQHKGKLSSGKLIPGGRLSLKRCRDSEDIDNTAKKVCLQDMHSGPAQTPNCTAGNSVRPSLVSQTSWRDLELLPKTTDGHLLTEPPHGQSACLALSPKCKSTLASCPSLMSRQPLSGVKPAYITLSPSQIVKLKELKSPSKPVKGNLKKGGEEKKKDHSYKRHLLTGQSAFPHKNLKDTSSSHSTSLGSYQTGHTQCSTPVSQVKSLSREDTKAEANVGKSRGLEPSQTLRRLSHVSQTMAEGNRSTLPQRSSEIPNDIDDLFTPDPLTYVISPVHKPVKPSIEGGQNRSPASHKSGSSSTVTTTSSTPSTGPPCHKTQNVTITLPPTALDTKISPFSSLPHLKIFLPTVRLKKVRFENGLASRDTGLKNSSIASSGRPLTVELVKIDEGPKSSPKNVRPCTLVADTASSKCTFASSSPTTPVGSEGVGKRVHEEDPLDVEQGGGLSFGLDFNLTDSFDSKEDEQLPSLQEMMARIKPPDTLPSCQSKAPLPSTAKSGTYNRSRIMDDILNEMTHTKNLEEIGKELLIGCNEDRLELARCMKAVKTQEEAISAELKVHHTLWSVHPGEVVFNLENVGQLFNQHTLQLRKCNVNPQDTLQKTLQWPSPAQLRSHAIVDLFQDAYYSSPCPAQVTRFLFMMMSVHTEGTISEHILQLLRHIACVAAQQKVKNGKQQFEVWMPSVADATLVLMNMGAAFVTLFPFENRQPLFTEADLLEDIHISWSPSRDKELSIFPEHNYDNILKYLCVCTALCPRAYSDYDLLLLLTVLSKVSLDTHLTLQPNVDLCDLQENIVNNIRNWDTMLPRICLALTDLTDDHHNMCWLVQLLPNNPRGMQLRQHLGLSMISKLLDGTCTYRPTGNECQLADLQTYLPRMRPSALRDMLRCSSSTRKESEEDFAALDQQSCYLCYSLLTLANEVSNFRVFPTHQKEQLLFLCRELEAHINCDFRAGKWIYRHKVKDLVARMYNKWEKICTRINPLNGRLHDWFSLVEETKERDDELEEQEAIVEEEEEEIKGTEED